MNWVNNNVPIMQPQQQPIPQQIRRMSGRWQEISNYQEMQTMPLPFDGTPILFMLANEPVIYMASMQNGQKCVSGFRLEPISIDESQTQGQPSNVDQRLASLEEQIKNLVGVLKGSDKANESNTATIPQPQGITTTTK